MKHLKQIRKSLGIASIIAETAMSAITVKEMVFGTPVDPHVLISDTRLIMDYVQNAVCWGEDGMYSTLMPIHSQKGWGYVLRAGISEDSIRTVHIYGEWIAYNPDEIKDVVCDTIKKILEEEK